MTLVCELGIWRGSCKAAVEAQCSYCGKYFCLKHGYQDKAVCSSSDCVKKYKYDLAMSDRLVWETEQLEIGIEKNAAGLCGFSNCSNEIYMPCGHCNVFFCSSHVTKHTYSFILHSLRRGSNRTKGDITLCGVCTHYLSDYKRDKYE